MLRPFKGAKGEMGPSDTTVACTLDYIYPPNGRTQGVSESPDSGRCEALHAEGPV